jgi:hypothetical protein
VADAQVELVGKTGTSLDAKRIGDIEKRMSKTGGALGAAGKQSRELFGKGALSTGGGLAEKPPHAQQQANLVVADWQITRSAKVAAMHAQRGLVAGRTAGVKRSMMRLQDQGSINETFAINSQTRKER